MRSRLVIQFLVFFLLLFLFFFFFVFVVFFFFFFTDTATTEIYTLSLHDALPISRHNMPGFFVLGWREIAFLNACGERVMTLV